VAATDDGSHERAGTRQQILAALERSPLYSEVLRIRLRERRESTYFRWFLASLLFGHGTAFRNRYRLRTDIDAWSEPPIEPNLLFTEVLAQLDRRKIQKGEPHWLLQLVGKAIGEKNP
jgi:hypothetical protein